MTWAGLSTAGPVDAARSVAGALPGTQLLRRGVSTVGDRGLWLWQTAGGWAADRARAAVRRVVDVVIDQVDVDAIVDKVDVDAIVDKVDVDAIVDKVDFEAVLRRIDIAGLAREVVDAIDLPEIVRQSSGTMASETVRGVRMQSIDADELVSRALDRVLMRREHPTPRAGPGPAGTGP